MTEYFLLGVGLLLVPLFTIMSIEIITNDSVDNLLIIAFLVPYVMAIGALYFGVDNLINGKIENLPKDVKELIKK